MNQCSSTRISRGFTLIVDDSVHRKSGNFTAGVGRQYIGELGKTDNPIVVVTTHLYDGRKSLPLDIELHQYFPLRITEITAVRFPLGVSDFRQTSHQ